MQGATEVVVLEPGVRPDIREPMGGDTAGRKNLQQLIQLRWLAVLGQVVTIAVAYRGFGVPLPLDTMLTALGGLVIFNAASVLRLHLPRDISNGELFLALLVDVCVLTIQLYVSGGATNPFVFLYLLQVILGAVLLKAWSTWTMVAVTALCFAGLALVGEPLQLPADHHLGLDSPYVQGMLICFVLNAGLLVIFITRITHNLRARDARLADLRQRAAEKEHIVRMGLLASGAAHELGTPLSTLAVILGDWRRMPTFAADPDLVQEIDEMQAQVQRCKMILRDILLSAGETRGEAPMATTVHGFLDGLVAEWRKSRSVKVFIYENHFGKDLEIVSDSAIKQMIHNLLDNALEASPNWVRLDIARKADSLVLSVTDRGFGFPPEILAGLGKPYQSTKGLPGSGLGLFLVVNVARTLGGGVTVRNRAMGGAVVTLVLPLQAVRLKESEDEHIGA